MSELKSGEQTFEYPTPLVPTVPEYFRKGTFEGMLPGDMSFPFAIPIKFDPSNGRLALKTNFELDDGAKDPQFFGSRAGIMRIYESNCGKLVDGYIADLRHVKPGEIGGQELSASENVSPTDTKFINGRLDSSNYSWLLGAAFTDPDGNSHIMCDSRLREQMLVLMSAVDSRSNSEANNQQTPPPEDVPAPALPGEYYLG